MKSKIKFLNNPKDSRVKKLITEEIISYEKNSEDHARTHYSTEVTYDLLFNAKYIIERDNLDVGKIIEGDVEELIRLLREDFKELNSPVGRLVINNIKKYKLYEILRKMIYEDYEIVTYSDRVLDSYIENNKKYLLICESPLGFINHPNVDIYYQRCSIYMNQLLHIEDKLLEYERKYYTSLEDIPFREYDSVIYINNNNEYKDISSLIGPYYIKINNMLMICNYSTISRYKSRIERIKSFLIDKDKAYLEYQKVMTERLNTNRDDFKICIKDLSNIKDEDLKEIINTDKEIENVCKYVTLRDIRVNSHRIGFKVYNRELNADRGRILRLIDYNAYLTGKIKELDIEISNQIDRMIVK